MKGFGLKLVHWPLWWYGYSLIWFKRLFINLIVFLDNKLAVSLMAQMLLVPLFHDTSIVGRILSLIFRLARILFGSVVMMITIAAMLFWLGVWLLLPAGLIWGLKEIGWVIIGLAWLIDSLNQLINADRTIDKQLDKLVKKAENRSEKLKQLLLDQSEVTEILTRLELVRTTMEKMPGFVTVKDWLDKAGQEAAGLEDKQIGFGHLLLAWLKMNQWRYQEAVKTYSWLKLQQVWAKQPFLWDEGYANRPMGGINRDWTGVPTPTLNKYSTDLTKLATKAKLPEILAKEKALDQLVKVLSRKQKNNAVVIGPPGSGKSSLVKGFAQEIVRGVKYRSLRFKRLVALDAARLAAGANSAELNQRLTTILKEVEKAGNIILFVDELHNLASINQDLPETSDVFIALEPLLSDGAFQFIGATTTSNYKKFIEPNQAFSRLLETVELDEASQEDTLRILKYLAWQREKEDRIKITTLALEKMISLAGQLIHDRVFPDKAVNLLDEVLAIADTKDQPIVTSVLVEKLVSEKTKVPVTELTKAEADKLMQLESKLHQRVVGQDEAIKAVADAIRRARTQIKDPKKPIASFMFAGPTGVGKTETAKALASEFFGSEETMIRLDMSEFQNLDSINRLIGAPPGQGLKEGGQLTEAVRHQPYTLILLDEIEKAHPKILNLFLQVLDDARLSDSEGRIVDFSNSIIIATTNVGTKELMAKVKQGRDKLAEIGKQALENEFAPEFLNRFTGLVVFMPLNEKQVKEIVKIKLDKLINNLAKQEIKLVLDRTVIDWLAKAGFSDKWGGRQIERVIQEKVANVLAKKILKQEVKKNLLTNLTVKDLQA